MTGFARRTAETLQFTLCWEVRSVNHRYLETQIRLPEALRGLEAEARQSISQNTRRGKLDATLSLKMLATGSRQVTLNRAYAEELIGHARSLAVAIGDAALINPVDILRWPTVLQEEEPLLDELQPLALSLLQDTLYDLHASRDREGARLYELLDTRCSEILDRVAAVRARLPLVLAAIRQRLEERVRSLVTSIDAQRLEQELVLIAQKLDVAEELDRLEGHVVEFRHTMSGREPAGRRLDFLLQEFNREANTLASKSADAETTRHAVDLKVLIEQMREQVQNVE